ncbi:MAG: flagellar hook-length control protein FliK [Acutalibacter sp.]|jgi:flagellar hook-length control protein FliK
MQVENGILQILSAVTKNPQSSQQTQQSGDTSFGELLDNRMESVRRDPAKDQSNTSQQSQTAGTTQEPVEQQTSQKEEPGVQQQEQAVLWNAAMLTPAQWNVQVQVPQEQAAPAEAVETVAVAVVPVEAETAATQVAETAVPQVSQNVGDQVMVQQPVEQQTGEVQPETVGTPVQQPQENAGTQWNSQTGSQQSQGEQTMDTASQDHGDASVDVKVQEVPVETNQSVFGQVESVPVKVGEVEQPQQTENTPSVETQLKDGLTQALSNGDTKVEIQLNPAELGNVKIEVTRSAEGAIYVVLSAEHAQTQSLLEHHAAGLQSMLMGSSGTENVQVQVNRHQEGQQAENQNYDGSSGNGRENQQQREHQRQQQEGTDFLQQLRLGLVPQTTI